MATPNFSAWDSQIHNAADALAPRPPRIYAAKPFFAIPSLSIVYGISGSHKTNLMVDLVVCVSMGRKWLEGKPGDGIEGYEVTRSGVLWIDQDSGLDALNERFGAMLRAHGGNAKTPIHYMSFPAPPFVALQTDVITEVSRRAKLLDAKIIVFDNLGTISGGKDENSSEMILVMNNLRLLSQDCGAAVVIIHHDVKNDNGKRKTPRGHSSIEAAIDLALLVTREKDIVTLAATKTRGAEFETFAALWTYQHMPNTLTLGQARFFGLGMQKDPKVAKAEQVIIETITLLPDCSQLDLITAGSKAKISKMIILSVLGQLILTGTVKEIHGKKHNQKSYSL